MKTQAEKMAERVKKMISISDERSRWREGGYTEKEIDDCLPFPEELE